MNTELVSVHIAAIHSSCRKLDWSIKPHSHSKLYQFLLIESGAGTFVVGEKTRSFSGRTLIIVPHNILHGFRFSEDIQGYTLSVPSDLINRIGHSDRELITGVSKLKLVELASMPDDFNDIRVCFQSIRRELQRQEVKMLSCIESVVQYFLIKLFRMHVEGTRDCMSSNRDLIYYQEFVRTMKQGVPTHRSIEDFTRVVGISKTHLNRVCQTITGESTKQLISRYIATQAMILLTYSDLSISEIAHQLEFKDVSYFCRFFKKQAGLPPAHYRNDNILQDAVSLNY